MKDITKTIEIDQFHSEFKFDSPGERFNHLLDLIGFKQGRGRVSDLQSYLAEHAPSDFSEIKYTTARSWFLESAPQMRKIDAIIEALQSVYTLNGDLSQIKTWWKLGGLYPFTEDEPLISDPEFVALKAEVEAHNEKLDFVITSLVSDYSKDHFNDLSGKELNAIKDKVLKFAKDYSDPFKIDCPTHVLSLIAKKELSSILNSKK
jgi:hypothetical protein